MQQRRILITGIVQGVGFRPFIYRIAVANALTGSVKNRGDAGVEILVQGEPEQIERFLQDLQTKAPPLAQIVSLKVEPVVKPEIEHSQFVILPSEQGGEGSGTIPPDVAICEECLQDIRTPTRYQGYWATSCTNCGPRFTVIESLPYDRERTSMIEFPMCEACRKEYTNPLDRRYHAQTIACAQCGPRLFFIRGSASKNPPSRLSENPADPIAETVQALRAGRVVAIKGIGGTHLACDASREEVVAKLRQRRHRFFQPFAIMATEEMVSKIARVSPPEWKMLRKWQRPIVVLDRLENAPLAPSVAPGLHNVGIMLPYSGVHELIFAQIDFPLVMTSANMPGEPMLIENEAIVPQLQTVADDFLLHDRRIVARCDDSVVRFSGGGWKLIRRSRGWAPAPIDIPLGCEPILALGAELQNTIALYTDGKCYISQHIGDVDDLETFEFLKEALHHLLAVTGQSVPHRIACDLHPQFLTTTLAYELSDSVVQVQHHHAHIASVMGEHHLEKAIGIALDGIGYGSDGRIWGGEVLLTTRARFQKIGGLSNVLMPGGDLATKYPARMAAGILYAGGIPTTELRTILRNHVRFPHGSKEEAVVLQQLRSRANTFETSSAGRFLDAVSALLGLCEERTYEGEPAMRLESAAVQGTPQEIDLKFVTQPAAELSILSEGNHSYPYHLRFLDVPSLFLQLLEMKEQGSPVADIAATAQHALARGLVQIALEAAREHGIPSICLSGGVAYNDFITRTIKQAVEQAGYEFYTNEKVPCGDGGIAFGQVVVAAARK